MRARRRLALYGVVVASTAEGSAKISASIISEDGTAKHDGDGFHNVRMWCMLRVR